MTPANGHGHQDHGHAPRGPRVHPPNAPRRNENIRSIVDLEHAALARRSPTERLSDGITRFLGSGLFLIFHVVWFAFWILAGLEAVPGLPKFDQFPFGLLTMLVSLEAIFLAIVAAHTWTFRLICCPSKT